MTSSYMKFFGGLLVLFVVVCSFSYGKTMDARYERLKNDIMLHEDVPMKVKKELFN